MTGMMPVKRSDQTIQFVGSTRADAKRKALNYWYMHRQRLGLSIREYSGKLVMVGDGKTIVFSPESPR